MLAILQRSIYRSGNVVSILFSELPVVTIKISTIMKYRNLGKTGIPISEIGFGCMSLGKNSDTQSIRLVHQAIDAGINYFDTADIYDAGDNEKLIGKAIKEHRNKIVLATKVGNKIKPGGGTGFDWDPSKKHILKAIDESLKRLQTDYINLYQLHGGTIDDPIDETIEAFEILKQQGKILHYGISSIRPNVIREYVKRSNIESVMMQYSLLDRRPEEAMLSLLEEHKISMMARGALAQGLLIDKPPKEYVQQSTAGVKNMKELLILLSGTKEKSADAAIYFVLQNTAVTSAIIGFRAGEQLKEVLNSSFSLSKEALQTLLKLPAKKYLEHR